MKCDVYLLLHVPARILEPASVLKLAILPVKMVKNRTNDKLRGLHGNDHDFSRVLIFSKEQRADHIQHLLIALILKAYGFSPLRSIGRSTLPIT